MDHIQCKSMTLLEYIYKQTSKLIVRIEYKADQMILKSALYEHRITYMDQL